MVSIRKGFRACLRGRTSPTCMQRNIEHKKKVFWKSVRWNSCTTILVVHACLQASIWGPAALSFFIIFVVLQCRRKHSFMITELGTCLFWVVNMCTVLMVVGHIDARKNKTRLIFWVQKKEGVAPNIGNVAVKSFTKPLHFGVWLLYVLLSCQRLYKTFPTCAASVSCPKCVFEEQKNLVCMVEHGDASVS